MIGAISIVIPTLNEEHCLPQLLASIAEQNFKGLTQVIVVDAGSDDQTVAVARKYGNKLRDLTVIQDHRDIGRQRNVGASFARYDNLLFLDADVVLPTNFLSTLLLKRRKDDDFIEQVIHFPRGGNVLDAAAVTIGYMLILLARIAGSPVVIGDCIFTTKRNHARIAGFAEGTILGEDTDYGLRSVKHGAVYRLHLRPHIYGSPRRARRIGRLRLLNVWARSFLYVRRHGPIRRGQGVEYPYSYSAGAADECQ